MMKLIKFLFLFLLSMAISYPATNIYAEDNIVNDLNQAKNLYYEDINSSLQRFNQLVDNEPQNESARIGLIRILREMGQYQTAISQLKILIQQNPDERRYRLALIETTFMAGELSETLRLSNITDLTPDELFWKGLALAELGIHTEAIQALNNAIADEPLKPLAYYNLGVQYLKVAGYEKAVIFLKKAAAQDPHLSRVYLPLVNAYIGLKMYRTAYHYLLVAKDEMPWNQEISIARKKLLAKHPEALRPLPDNIQEQKPVTIQPEIVPVLDGRDNIPEIRIGLTEKIKQLSLRSGASFILSDNTGKVRFQGQAQSLLKIRQTNYRIEVLNRYGERLFRTTNNLFLSYEDPAATTTLFKVQYRQGKFWAGGEARKYRGGLQFLLRNGGLTIVNNINLEEYLYGVVPSEMESVWPLEALKAQAIAARTYAISHKNAYKTRGFDLLPTVASQVYGGVRTERETTNNAVDATRGRVLTYNGKPISAFYTGNSGGYTTSSEDVWGSNIEYLQAIPDKKLPTLTGPMGPEELAEWLTSRPLTYSCHPQYSAPSNYRWTVWVPRAEIERRLRLGNKLGRILSIVIKERAISGVVTKVFINGSKGQYTINGDVIRSKLGGLRSNMFIMQPKLGKDGLPEVFIFNGGGWGHGVGLDQSGAAGMAADDYKFDEILKHYYPGVEIETLY